VSSHELNSFAADYCHDVPPHHRPQGNRADQSWTESSKTESKNKSLFFFLSFFLEVLGFEIRPSLYHLNHTSSPLCFFEDRVLSLKSSRSRSSYLCLLHRWVYRCIPPHSACLLRWSLNNFFARAGLEPLSFGSPPPE
jgi:hypothetical protein